MCADANFRINVVAEQHNIVATSPNHTRQFKPYIDFVRKVDQIIETVKSVAFHRLLLSGSRPHDISFNFKHAQNFARNVGVIIHYTKKELDSFHCLWCATSSTAVWQSKAAVTLFEVLACIIYRSDYNDLLSMYLNTQGQCFQIQDRANK